jgi:ABC-type sugar transport system substrate-binding protein
MSDIFISYAREDQPRAEMLAQTLEGRGWSIFWDRTIPVGKTWRETIGRELDDARCVIVLWSKTSIESGWVQDEADDAKGRGVLVPILIENVQPPMGFRSIQAAHLEDWDGTQPTQAFRSLIADIAAVVGRPPKEIEKDEEERKLIFISYKHEDRHTIEPLIKALESLNFDVWWDDELLPGERIAAVINEVLDKAACVIVVWSKLSSESNWVPDEAAYGRDHSLLIQVTFDGSRAPLGYQQLLVLDLGAWSGDLTDPRFQKVVTRIRSLLRPVRQPKSLQVTTELRVPNQRAGIDRIRSRYAAIRNKRIFLIVSSFNEDWQIFLNRDLIRAAQRADLLCSVLVPFEDHSFEQQRALLQSIEDHATDYVGGIIVCSGWPDRFMEESAVIVKRFSIPIVVVDRNPPVPDSEIPPKVTYVSVSDQEGGALAADAVLELAETHTINRILVIKGVAKSKRHEAFKRRLKISRKLKGCEIAEEDGKFDRWTSENVAYNHIAQAEKDSKPFDVVFCTADSMTMGCLHAIDRVEGRKPKVIGYDGTPETITRADKLESPLVRIVIQDSKELAGAAIARLISLNQNQGVADGKKVIWVNPTLYPPRLKRTLI